MSFGLKFKDNLILLFFSLPDNIFDIVVPHTLCDAWDIQPSPNKPVYGFIGLEVADTGSGSAQQIYKPFRGFVEVRYSPSEA